MNKQTAQWQRRWPAVVMAAAVILAACTPGSAPPTAVAVTATPSAGPSDSATATAPPTGAATATTPAPPTATSAPPTAPPLKPSATPAGPVTLADLTGTWTLFDDLAGGPNWYTFNADGTYVAAHGPDRGSVRITGVFTLEAGVLTFGASEGPAACPANQAGGQYQLKLLSRGEYLQFTPLNDPCPERVGDFERLGLWQRADP